MPKNHLRFNKAVMGIWECAELLNEFVHESEPDLDISQIQRLLQTVEAIRIDYPCEEDDWFPLTGFIHDLGKFLLHSKVGGETQWAVVGKLYFSSNYFYMIISWRINNKMKHFNDNPHSSNPKYNTKNGICEEGCGLDNV
eukprot:Gb_39623 [translate_table: standard]